MYDMIAVANKVGQPYIFLTMTCNPNWREIRSALKHGQTAINRPDLCVRVFKLKFQAFLYTFNEMELFGKTVAWVKVIEFQKRDFHTHTSYSFWKRQGEKNSQT